MFSIGTLSRRSGVKVPTIRYYEQAGILNPAGRTAGNQRRYSAQDLERVVFIRHARELGFSIDAISRLIDLQQRPDCACAEASDIASEQLTDVQLKIARLQRLETELNRIVNGCTREGTVGNCYVLESLAEHALCETDHATDPERARGF